MAPLPDGSLDLGFADEVEAPVATLPERPAPLPAVPFTYTEQHRHECEVRYVAGLDYERRTAYCAGIVEKRGRDKAEGRALAERLWVDALKLIRKKNDDA